MSSRLIIDGNTVYEIDEECIHEKQKEIPTQGEQGQKVKSAKGTKPA